MPVPIATAIGAGVGLAQTITGLINNAEAKKVARELEKTRPKYAISGEVDKELDQAESEVGGMSARAERAYTNLNNQQFASSLSAILKGGGSVNNIAETFGAGEEGRQRLALLSDEMRLRQIDDLTRARRYKTEQEDKRFMYNIDAPWKDKAQAASVARQQAQQDIWGGVQTAVGAGMQYSAGVQNEKMWDRYFGYGNRPAGNATINPVSAPRLGSLNPTAMGAGSSYPSIGRRPTPPVAQADYWSPQMEQEQFANDFGLNYF